MLIKFNHLVSFVILSFFAMSCNDNDDICSDGFPSVVDQCGFANSNNMVFTTFPDFYCWQDSIAIIYSKEESVFNKMIVHRWKYRLNKEDPENFPFVRVIYGLNDFADACLDSPTSDKTFLFIYMDMGDKIDESTTLVMCDMYLSSHPGLDQDFKEEYIIEKKRISLKRVW